MILGPSGGGMKTLCPPFAFPDLRGTTGRSRQPFFPRPRAQNIMARIALILPRLSRYGGVEQFAFRLAEALASHRGDGMFAVLFLDTRHRLIEYAEMFQGTIDSAEVHPREVVKAALRHNAAAVIVSHNHPSGNPEPSAADQALTQRLREALGLVDVRVLDHVIVAGNATASFAERGLI